VVSLQKTIHPSFLKDSFALNIVFLIGSFYFPISFYFEPLRISYHSLLAYEIVAEKSAASLMGVIYDDFFLLFKKLTLCLQVLTV
jgi:hypothetical protein